MAIEVMTGFDDRYGIDLNPVFDISYTTSEDPTSSQGQTSKNCPEPMQQEFETIAEALGTCGSGNVDTGSVQYPPAAKPLVSGTVIFPLFCERVYVIINKGKFVRSQCLLSPTKLIHIS